MLQWAMRWTEKTFIVVSFALALLFAAAIAAKALGLIGPIGVNPML